MVEETVFRLDVKRRLTFLIWFLVSFFFTAWVYTKLFPIIADTLTPTSLYKSGNLWTASVICFVIALAGILLVITAFLGYNCIYWWTYQLVFSDSHLETKSIYNPRVPPFRHTYPEIKQVRWERQEVLQIVPIEGKPLELGVVEAFVGGWEAIAAELSRHISAGIIEPKPDKPSIRLFRQPKRNQKALSVILYLFLVVFTGYIYAMVGHNYVRQNVAWKSSIKLEPRTTLEQFVLGADGSPWILAEGWFSGKLQLLHVTNASVAQLDLPANYELHETLPSGWPFRPRSIVIDSYSRPWVAFSPLGLLHWAGSEWEWFSFPVIDIKPKVHDLVATDSKLWARVQPENGTESYLFSIDPSAGNAQIIPLPPSAYQSDMKLEAIRATPDGALLALVSNGSASSLYMFREGRWQDSAYDIDLDPFDSAITADKSGRIWVAVPDTHTCEKGNEAIARIGTPEAGNGPWVWSTTSCLPNDSFNSLIIDGQGRFWLGGRDFVDVYEITPGETPRQIVRYTPTNSNYQNDLWQHAMSLGSDGRLWTAHRELVWIDSNTPNLPQPLPGWLATVASEDAKRYVWHPLFLAMTAGIVIFNLKTFSSQTKSK